MTSEHIRTYFDKKWKFAIYKLATDDVDDEFFAATKTEQEAKNCVKQATEAYGDSEEFQFRYEAIK